MSDLVEFLTARLREEKAAAERARKAGARRWWARNVPRFDHGYPRWQVDLVLPPRASPRGAADCFDEATAAYIARHDPARTLREVAAKREIVKRYERAAALLEARGEMFDRDPSPTNAREHIAAENVLLWLEEVVKALAAPHADHPDYKPTWALPLER